MLLQIGRYFLDDMERVRMENGIVEWIPGANRWILDMDDEDLVEVYYKCLKEQAAL
ncbi:hypothetical protein [Bacillus sp. 165]|uniref:hypothetical protein n=1 Tax=Bacillus sp. 165 TaxID=1529117 RepID=UPI001ADD59D2|nr:hypothetical protein [Bacillus sp. 165]MBO9130006.1 hypothetical protein [Bacillus sp. 165]